MCVLDRGWANYLTHGPQWVLCFAEGPEQEQKDGVIDDTHPQRKNKYIIGFVEMYLKNEPKRCSKVSVLEAPRYFVLY